MNFSDPFGLDACTKEEVDSGRETVANQGGSICVERRQRQTDAERACSAAIAIGYTRTVADALTIWEGGPALKMAAKALFAEAKSGVIGYAANISAVGGARAAKLSRDAAKTNMAANRAYGNALGLVGSSALTDASRPREDNSSFSLTDVIPLWNVGQDVRSAITPPRTAPGTVKSKSVYIAPAAAAVTNPMLASTTLSRIRRATPLELALVSRGWHSGRCRDWVACSRILCQLV